MIAIAVPPPPRAPSFKLKKSRFTCVSRSGARVAQITSRIVIWDVVSRNPLLQFKTLKNPSGLAWSQDERVMAVKNTNGELVFYDAQCGVALSATGPFRYYREGGRPAFTGDGLLLDGDWSGVLRMMDPSSAAEIARKEFGFGYMFGQVCANSTDAFAVLNAKHDTRGGSRLLHYGVGKSLARPNEIRPPDAHLAVQGGWRHIDAMALNPSGTCIALALSGRTPDEANAIVLLELGTGLFQAIELPSRRHHVKALAWSALGVLCATVHENTWRDGMTSAEFTADRARNVYQHLHFYSTATAARLSVWAWRGVDHLSFSDDGRCLVVSNWDFPGVCYVRPEHWLPDDLR